jgi:hypothetical protein
MGLHYHASVDSDWLRYLDCDIIHSITSDLEYNQKERYILCVVQTVAEIISERWAGILTELTIVLHKSKQLRLRTTEGSQRHQSGRI